MTSLKIAGVFNRHHDDALTVMGGPIDIGGGYIAILLSTGPSLLAGPLTPVQTCHLQVFHASTPSVVTVVDIPGALNAQVGNVAAVAHLSPRRTAVAMDRTGNLTHGGPGDIGLLVIDRDVSGISATWGFGPEIDYYRHIVGRPFLAAQDEGVLKLVHRAAQVDRPGGPVQEHLVWTGQVDDAGGVVWDSGHFVGNQFSRSLLGDWGMVGSYCYNRSEDSFTYLSEVGVLRFTSTDVLAGTSVDLSSVLLGRIEAFSHIRYNAAGRLEVVIQGDDSGGEDSLVRRAVRTGREDTSPNLCTVTVDADASYVVGPGPPDWPDVGSAMLTDPYGLQQSDDQVASGAIVCSYTRPPHLADPYSVELIADMGGVRGRATLGAGSALSSAWPPTSTQAEGSGKYVLAWSPDTGGASVVIFERVLDPLAGSEVARRGRFR